MVKFAFTPADVPKLSRMFRFEVFLSRFGKTSTGNVNIGNVAGMNRQAHGSDNEKLLSRRQLPIRGLCDEVKEEVADHRVIRNAEAWVATIKLECHRIPISG